MAIHKKTEGRDLEEYLQEVWDSLEPAWDKSKFDMKQGYDSEYECDCITITSKDNEGVRAKIYVNDYEGKHPVGFDVVYRYPGDKGVGVMGSYEFQSTDMDNLGEEVFDYFDEIKQKVGESMKNEADTPEEAIKQILLDAAKDREFRREAGEDFSVEDYEKSIDANIEKLRDYFLECFYFDEGEFKCEVQDHEETRNLCSLVAYKVGYALGLSDGVSDAIDGYLLWYGVQENIVSDESKKSEADATFKVGDFVNYDAESDGKDVYDSFIPCEVVDVNDDGTLGLCVYGSYADEEGLGENASASCCRKLDNYAGMVDANTYYTDGKYKAYKGGWEILITEKELDPKVYEFIGTMDDLSEVVDFDDYYGGENFVYDEDLRDDLGATGVDTDGVDFADMSGDVAKASGSPEESKKSEGANTPPTKEEIKRVVDGLRKDKAFSRRYSVSDSALYGAIDPDWSPSISITDKKTGKKYADILFDGDGKVRINGFLYSPFEGDSSDIDWILEILRTKKPAESKKSEGLPPKKLGDRRYRSRADLINKMKQLGATEITTRDQYDELRNKQWLHKGGYAMDINGNLVGQTYFGDKDGKWYYASSKTFQGDYLPECKEAKKSESTENTTESERISFIKDLANKLGIDNLEEDRASAHMNGWRYFNNDDEGGDGVVLSLKAYPWARDDQSATIDVWLETGRGVIGDCWLSFDFGGDYKNRINADTILTTLKNQLHTLWSRREGVAKKSESLTLKQKELKDMARFGQAEDITTISDEEAKALRKKGIETIGVSRGTYGMNGALLRDNEGKKYVITARSSNLFYFV